MSERLQGAEVDQKDAFLFMARRFLEERVREDTEAGDPVDPEKSLYTILYHMCPECRSASLPTSEGPVEIDSEVVERVEGDARKVVIEDSEERAPAGESAAEGDGAAERSSEEDRASAKEASQRELTEGRQPAEIDRPNPPSLVRKIHLRDGRTCSNPGCERTHGLHAHHILERAQGGATAVYNEILVCSTCHSLLHAGQLRLEGNPADGLVWQVSAGETSEDLWTQLGELSSVPEVQVLDVCGAGSTAVDSDVTVEATGSTAVDSKVMGSTAVDSEVRSSERFQYLVRALRTLGFSAAQSKRRLVKAWESFGARVSEASDEDLVKSALRIHAA